MKSKTYQVLTGHGVAIKASEEYHYVRTDGLRTCVAFAIINLQDYSTMLIHFYSLHQVKTDLKLLVTKFIKKSTIDDKGITIIIAGGREFVQTSIEMCEQLIKFSKELAAIIPVTLRLNAPVVAEEAETLSIQINLLTGDSEMSMTLINSVETGDYEMNPLGSIVYNEMSNEEEKEHNDVLKL